MRQRDEAGVMLLLSVRSVSQLSEAEAAVIRG